MKKEFEIDKNLTINDPSESRINPEIVKSTKQLEKEVSKMYYIRIILFICSLTELILSIYIFFFFLRNLTSQIREIRFGIFRDHYSPKKRKDRLLGYFGFFLFRLIFVFYFLFIVNIFMSFIFSFTGAVRYSFCGNLNIESTFEKAFCYFCCCCKMACLKVFNKFYLIENFIVWGICFYFIKQLSNFFDIDDDLDEQVDELRTNGFYLLLIYFIKLCLYPIILYCLGYVEYFLSRTLIYFEYYKNLVESGQVDKADKVRKLLGYITTHNKNENLIELSEI